MTDCQSAAGYPPAPRGVSSRTVLRLGYGSVIAILVFSSVEAYRIQGIVSDEHVDIYRQYVKQDEAVSQLRRGIWLAGNYVRDFFLSSNPDRSAYFQSELHDLQAQSRQALVHLEQVNPNEAATRLLKVKLQEYWTKIEPISESMAAIRAPEAYNFIQQEVVTRRTGLSDTLRQISGASQAALQRHELEFMGKRQDAVRRLLIMLGLCVVLSLLVSRFSLRHADRLERETVRQCDEVTQAKREMEELSARLLDIEEDSRRRLSRELHDEIGQTLAVLQIEVSHAQALTDENQGRLRDRLQCARELAEKTVQTVRDISLLLRPALLDDLGLVPALQWLLEDFQRRSGVSAEFSGEGVRDLLPDSVKTCVYRVVQEALHNSEKHSGASEVRVAVRQSTNQLRVDIEDNGRGLELNAKGMPQRKAGLGILGMRERAAKVRGTLELVSSPGRGTQICLQIPLAELADDDEPVAIAEVEVNAHAYSNPVGG
jgi:signal transduction histidine kinase